MKKLLALFLTATALATVPLTQAGAHEAAAATATVPVAGTTAVLPATVHLDETVVIEHRHHRRFRSERRVYYRHGVRRVVIRRVYY